MPKTIASHITKLAAKAELQRSKLVLEFIKRNSRLTAKEYADALPPQAHVIQFYEVGNGHQIKRAITKRSKDASIGPLGI